MIILYSTHCPKCNVLQAKLNQKNIEYIQDDNIEHMKELNIKMAPVLSIDGALYQFSDAIKIVNNWEEK